MGSLQSYNGAIATPLEKPLYWGFYRIGIHPGQYWDEETGNHYNWNRYYDPGVGRYVEKDPIGLKAGDVNLYRYVQNRSTMFVDPKGLIKLNLLNPSKDPDMYRAFESQPDLGGGFMLTITGHSTKVALAKGNPLRFGDMTVDELIAYIIKYKLWVPGMTIKLQGCRSGEGEKSFAEQLAKALNSNVIGADGPIWPNPITGIDFDVPYPPFSIFDKTIVNMPNVFLPGRWILYNKNGRIGYVK